MSEPKLSFSNKLRMLGAIFTPSRGAVGSIYALHNGKEHEFYVRTPWGNMRTRPEVGMSLLFRQRFVKRFTQVVLFLVLVMLLVVLV